MKKLILIGTAFVLASAAGGFAWWHANKKSPEQEVIRLNMDVVRLQLKDPDSAKFESVFISTAKEGAFVCGHVNARNAMGGYTGSKGFISTFDSVKFEDATDPAIFQALWRRFCKEA